MSGKRTFVGAVRGGHAAPPLPSVHLDLNTGGDHAVGRVKAMQEQLLHMAYLKSAGLIPNGTPSVSLDGNFCFAGADYQDFKAIGGPYHMAHRAIATVHIGGRNLADFVAQDFSRYHQRGNPLTDPTLLHLVVAPQARTDPLPGYANYADGYLERFLQNTLGPLFQEMLHRQPASQPVERGLLVDALGRMKEGIEVGYFQAIASLQQSQTDKGYVAPTGQVPLFSAADLDTIDFEQLRPASMRRHTQQGEAPQIFLSASREHALHHTPAMTESKVGDAVAELAFAER
jgi:hypothetical protein